MAALLSYPPFPGDADGNEATLPPLPFPLPQAQPNLRPPLLFEPPPLLEPPPPSPPPPSPARKRKNTERIFPTAPKEPEALFIDVDRRNENTGPSTPFSNIPPQIAHYRALLFALATPVSFSKEGWEQYWPYIDNVWCLHQRPKPSSLTGMARVYGTCRLARKVNYPDPPPGSRPRARRDMGICKAMLRVTVYADGTRLVERTSEAGHSHDMDYIDSVKRNSGVRNIVLDPFFKSWEAGGILAYLRDSSARQTEKTTDTNSNNDDNTVDDGSEAGGNGAGSNILDAGGLHICRQEVQNILNGALRRAHPGQDVAFVKKQMDKYKKYITCTNKGCNASAFPDIRALMEHRKQVHGLRTHDHSDKLYGCPDKTCWRKKKSKGFSTLLSLEEHVKEKHPERATADGLDLGNAGGRLPVSADLPMSAEFEPESGMEGVMSNAQQQSFDQCYNPSLYSPAVGRNGAMQIDTPLAQSNHQRHPITPESSAAFEAQMVAQLNAPVGGQVPQSPNLGRRASAEDQQAPMPLSYTEREKMKLRISRLKAERLKLDQEIARLCRAVWGNEGGNSAGAQDAG